jgi:ribonucleoside-diphosphate reductase alpha chain
VKFNEHHAPKRPKVLTAKVVRFNNNYEKWVAFVGLMDDKPYEVFTGKAENVDLPVKIETGDILKVKDNGTKRYDFEYEGGVVENISDVMDFNYWNYGKLISGMLRHGMPLQFVVDTIGDLTWEEEHINTWKNGVARALKKFIKDGKVEGIKCKDCNSENVVFEEGCYTCKECGSSACG